MKVETHLNGTLQLILIPETDLDRAILAEFSNRTKLGKKITVQGSDQINVSVEA